SRLKRDDGVGQIGQRLQLDEKILSAFDVNAAGGDIKILRRSFELLRRHFESALSDLTTGKNGSGSADHGGAAGNVPTPQANLSVRPACTTTFSESTPSSLATTCISVVWWPCPCDG